MEKNSAAFLTQFIDECWNKRSRSACCELLSPQYEHFMPGVEEPTVGPESYQQMVDIFVSAFPNVRFEIVEAFGENDRACAMWVMRGTHEGAFAGVEPTGREIVVRGVAVASLVPSGQIRKIVSMFDNDSFMRQLDAPAIHAAEHWRSSTAQGAG